MKDEQEMKETGDILISYLIELEMIPVIEKIFKKKGILSKIFKRGRNGNKRSKK